MNKELLQQMLDALNDSLDCVATEYAIYLENYGDYSSRKARIDMLKIGVDKHEAAIKALEVAIAQPEQGKLLQIIAAMYQIAGAYDAPEHVLDVLANPEGATQEQIDALLPFAQPEQPATVQGEPVGYRSLQPSGSYTYCNTPQFFDNAEPVYAAPQPAQAEPVQSVDAITKPLPGADWTITMRRMIAAGCSRRKCQCDPENAEHCIWWDEPGDAPQPAVQPAPVQGDPVKDMRHVGESQFEAWWADYRWMANAEITSKQIGRDGYAAGMGDTTPQPATSAMPAESEPFISKEWLAEKLASCPDDGIGASQPKRPCDTPPGCNAGNCFGCGVAQEGDAKDAERYRWLRMQDWFDGEICVLRNPKKVLTSGKGLGADCPSRERLDTFVDAVIASQKAQP